MTIQKGQSRNKISQGSEESHLRNLRILLEIQQKTLGPGEHSWDDIPLRIRPKSCYIFPLKVAATLLSGSGKGAVGA